MSRNDLYGRQPFALEAEIPSFLVPDLFARQAQNAANAHRPAAREIEDRRPFVTEDSGDAVNALVIRARLHDALEQRRIDLFMQPVVALPQRRVKFYEFFGRLRVRPGQYLPAEDYLGIAGEENLVSRLDRLFLARCLNVMEKQRRSGGQPLSYFINIKPFTLRDRTFMGYLLELLSQHPYAAAALIFEMPYRDLLMLSRAEQKIIEKLGLAGCRFSVDHIDHVPTDIPRLRAYNVRFVKIDAGVIVREGQSDAGFSDILHKKRTLDVNGIDLVVQKIEHDRDLKDILDYDVRYGQGFLFGRPDFQGVYTAYHS